MGKFGTSKALRANPTVDLAAHTAGDVIAKFDIAPVGGPTGGAVLKQISIIDDDAQNGAMTFLFFDGALTGTYTQNAAPAFTAADRARLLGECTIATGDWATIGGDGLACVEFFQVLSHVPTYPTSTGPSAPGPLTVVLLAGATQDYVTANPLFITFGIMSDDG